MAMASAASASCMVVLLIIGEEGFAGGDEAAPIIDY
jgi:hypothetical protein